MQREILALMAAFGTRLRYTPIARLRWLGRLHARLALGLHQSDEIMVGPFRVFVNPASHVIAKKLVLYGGFEMREIELLCSFVKPGDCVLDVGANIGLYSLALSKAVGPSGRVIAVEPDPDSLVLLRKNLEANGCTNVTVVTDALGDEAKTVLLYPAADGDRGSLSVTDLTGGGADGAIRVRMRRGDSVMTEIGQTARIAKMDVESAEPLVIAGLGTHLPEVLLFEYCPADLRTSGHDPLGFLERLVSLGYALAIVDPETGKQPVMQPHEIAVTAAQTECNILALRSASAR